MPAVCEHLGEEVERTAVTFSYRKMKTNVVSASRIHKKLTSIFDVSS
jgi:hypothetical protein